MANTAIVKKKKTPFYPYLNFSHRKLCSKSRKYMHEILHLTRDLYDTTRRMLSALALCKQITERLSQKSKKKYVLIEQDMHHFEELLYHIENYMYRLFAYRDKLCLFINFALEVGYEEAEMSLLNKLLKYEKVKESKLSTELNKFFKPPFAELLSRRKSMTHSTYYGGEGYSPYLHPNISVKKLGVRKAALEWRKNVIDEGQKIEKCMDAIFVLNNKIAQKTLQALSK